MSGVFAYHRRFLLLGYTYCFHILVGVVFVQSVSCEYARENGGACLAYALDGKDGIACIDLDGCMQENGDFSETAQQAFNAASGSYAEKSVSGKGLHILGKTKGADLRLFSADTT